jgi:hypothetical protein
LPIQKKRSTVLTINQRQILICIREWGVREMREMREKGRQGEQGRADSFPK